MSDTVLKLIPTDPRHVPPAETYAKASDLLAELTRGWEPEAQVFNRMEYIDPGENIEVIVCPRCRMRLELDWTPEHKAYFEWYGDIIQQEQKLGAESVQVVTPCCQQSVPFTELEFVDAGFALFELQVSNPEINYPMPVEMQLQIEAVLGCPIKQVWALY